MGMLYFIRHGQASFGDPDYDRLSSLGVLQSKLLGRYFLKTGVRFDAVYSGQMKRQKDTAAHVMDALGCNELTRHVCPCFDEYDHMAVFNSQLPTVMVEKNLSKKDIENILTDPQAFQKVFSAIMANWVSDPCPGRGVESFKGYSDRVRTGINQVVEKSLPRRKIAIFTSGGVISLGVQMALGLSNDKMTTLGWRVRNSSVTLFGSDGKPGDLALVSFNSTAHIELEQKPDWLTYR